MRWIKTRGNFLSEAKIRDSIFKRQASEVKSVWGEKYLDYEEITPTENIKQGVWKLEEADKMNVFGVFFGVDMNQVFEIFKNLPDKFVDVLNKSIKIDLVDKRWSKVLNNFDIRKPTIDHIYVSYENVFRKLSAAETQSDEMVSRDESGRPIMDENKKIVKVKKEKGDPIFSNNLININSFIEDYNRCYSENQVMSNRFSSGDVVKIRNRAGEDFSGGAYKIDMDIFSRDMFLSISHNPKDILNMSISKFYASCQHLYTGGYRQQVLGNVFDPNSIPAYFKFDAQIRERDIDGIPDSGELISDQLPLCRMMIRNIESFDDTSKSIKIFFDRCYPDNLKYIMDEMVEKYSKNIANANTGDTYIFTPDVNTDDTIKEPYMDKLRIERGKYIGVNSKTIYLNAAHDWSRVKVSPKANIKELIIETTDLPENIFKLSLNLDWVKFKFIKINTLKDFKLKSQSIGFDKCKFGNNVLVEVKEEFNIKKLQFVACDISGIDLSIFESLDELQLLYTIDPDEDLGKILGKIKVGKLVLSGDLLENKVNSDYIKSLRKSGVIVKIEGVVI